MTTKYDGTGADRILDRGALIRAIEQEYPYLRDIVYIGFIIQIVLGRVATPIS